MQFVVETASFALSCDRGDSRDNDEFIEDEEGFEFPDLVGVKIEAARALAELALDVLPGALKRDLAIEVRDEQGPVLIARLTFEALILRPALAAQLL